MWEDRDHRGSDFDSLNSRQHSRQYSRRRRRLPGNSGPPHSSYGYDSASEEVSIRFHGGSGSEDDDDWYVGRWGRAQRYLITDAEQQQQHQTAFNNWWKSILDLRHRVRKRRMQPKDGLTLAERILLQRRIKQDTDKIVEDEYEYFSCNNSNENREEVTKGRRDSEQSFESSSSSYMSAAETPLPAIDSRKIQETSDHHSRQLSTSSYESATSRVSDDVAVQSSLYMSRNDRGGSYNDTSLRNSLLKKQMRQKEQDAEDQERHNQQRDTRKSQRRKEDEYRETRQSQRRKEDDYRRKEEYVESRQSDRSNEDEYLAARKNQRSNEDECRRKEEEYNETRQRRKEDKYLNSERATRKHGSGGKSKDKVKKQDNIVTAQTEESYTEQVSMTPPVKSKKLHASDERRVQSARLDDGRPEKITSYEKQRNTKSKIKKTKEAFVEQQRSDVESDQLSEEIEKVITKQSKKDKRKDDKSQKKKKRGKSAVTIIDDDSEPDVDVRREKSPMVRGEIMVKAKSSDTFAEQQASDVESDQLSEEIESVITKPKQSKKDKRKDDKSKKKKKRGKSAVTIIDDDSEVDVDDRQEKSPMVKEEIMVKDRSSDTAKYDVSSGNIITASRETEVNEANTSKEEKKRKQKKTKEPKDVKLKINTDDQQENLQSRKSTTLEENVDNNGSVNVGVEVGTSKKEQNRKQKKSKSKKPEKQGDEDTEHVKEHSFKLDKLENQVNVELNIKNSKEKSEVGGRSGSESKGNITEDSDQETKRTKKKKDKKIVVKVENETKAEKVETSKQMVAGNQEKTLDKRKSLAVDDVENDTMPDQQSTPINNTQQKDGKKSNSNRDADSPSDKKDPFAFPPKRDAASEDAERAACIRAMENKVDRHLQALLNPKKADKPSKTNADTDIKIGKRLQGKFNKEIDDFLAS